MQDARWACAVPKHLVPPPSATILQIVDDLLVFSSNLGAQGCAGLLVKDYMLNLTPIDDSYNHYSGWCWRWYRCSMRKVQFRTVHKNHLVVHMKTCLESFPPPPSSKKSLVLCTFLMYFEFLDKKELMLCKNKFIERTCWVLLFKHFEVQQLIVLLPFGKS
jgi:hypothetical protein